MQKTKTQRDMRNDHLSTVVNQTTILQKMQFLKIKMKMHLYQENKMGMKISTLYFTQSSIIDQQSPQQMFL